MSWVWVTLFSCSVSPPPTSHALTGVVRGVEEGSLVIDHDEIPGFMPAMVMELPVEGSVEVVVGDQIEGALVVDGESFRLAEVRVTRRSESVPSAAHAWSEPLLLGETLERLEVPGVSGPTVLGAGQEEVTVLTFLFTTCPMPEACPLLATKLAGLQEELRGKARIVAVTLDPETDTLERLSEYAETVGADPQTWTFARLEGESLATLLSRVEMDVDRSGKVLTHNLRLLVLDRHGKLVYRHRDNSWTQPQLMTVIKPLLGATLAGAP